MILPRVHTDKLSAESRTRLELFYRRFCEGELRRQYGLGHLVYACHAAFPLALSPELANLIYINFNAYTHYGGATGYINGIAVSDFLLSPLCRQISNRQFEVYPEIRSYLLHLLKDEKWFYRYGVVINGNERLRELADFLQQYVAVKLPKDSYDGTGFRQLNEWAAQAYLDPVKLAGSLAGVLKDNKKDEQGKLWLNAQMGRIEKQFGFDIHNHGGSKEVLRPFFNLYFYTEARKGQLFKKSYEEIYANAEKISLDVPGYTGVADTFTMPLTKEVADRTERKIHKVQRVVSLLVAIDEYKQNPLRGCVHSAQRLREWLDERNGDGRQSRKEGGFDTKTVFTVFNEEATRQKIFAALTTLFSKADPEDICLLYFSGHGQNRSVYENTLMPVDFGLGNSPNLVNEDFRKAIEEGKRKTGCQVVMLLDSHTGYYKWVGENDIFLGAVRHTMQTENPFDRGVFESPFFHALAYILSGTKGKITYRHLLLWLRFLVKNELPNVDQTPVLMASLSNLDNYFLKKDLRNADDAPVMAFNPSEGRWHVLVEDFTLVTTNTTTYVKDYNNSENIAGASGEVFVRESGFLFGGVTKDLNRDALYRLDVGRPPLAVVIDEEGAQGNALMESLANVRFGAFSKWSGIAVAASGNKTKPGGNGERMVVSRIASGYVVRFEPRDQNEKPVIGDLRLSEASLVKEALYKFVRYHYLGDLDLPKTNYKLYERLSVHLHHRWLDKANEKDFTRRKLVVNEEAFRINGGRINILPLELQLSNDEDFPVFCAVCLLSSNLKVLQLTIKEISPLLPKTTLKTEVSEPEFFEAILAEGLSGQLKLLASRDPLQQDFSQTGINEPSTR